MTPDEADAVLARLVSAWPNTDLPDPTIGIWHEHLALMSGVVAMDAVRDLESGSRFFPSLAEFRQAYDVAVQRDRLSKAQDRGLPTPVERSVGPERAKELIEGLRAKINASKHDGKVRTPSAQPEAPAHP